jgi:hypothetical protein
MRIGMDFLRLTVLFGLSYALLRGDYSLNTLAISTGVSLFIVALSHLNRRVLFYRIEVQSLALKAAENPVGAGLVFCAIIYFLVALVNLQGGLLIGMLGK